MGIQRRRFRRSTDRRSRGRSPSWPSAGSAFALQGLPPGGQVNDDAAAGINPAQSVSGEEPANADVVGGALTAGKVAVPWAVFRQTEAAGGQGPDLLALVRGRRLDHPGQRHGRRPLERRADVQRLAELRPGAGRRGPGDRLRRRGADRAVGDVVREDDRTASEPRTSSPAASTTSATRIRASGCSPGRAAAPAAAAVPVPSLNIDTAKNAENPSVAGGTATPGGNPGPWVTWQEDTTAASGTDQIFVVAADGPGMANCDGVTPAGVVDGTGHVPAVGDFCWQQTGVPRVGSPVDPSLNVDPRATVSSLTSRSRAPGTTCRGWSGMRPERPARDRQPARPQRDGVRGQGRQRRRTAGNGGFHWVAVGNGGQGNLDASINGAGTCASSLATEQACSLNIRPTADAEDPRVASGTMNPANPTVPWVAWDEDTGTITRCSSAAWSAPARRRGSCRSTTASRSPSAGVDATRADITFSGNTPYVTWRSDSGGSATSHRRALRQRGQPDVRGGQERHVRSLRWVRPTCVSRSPRAARPTRSTPMEHRARALRSGRRSSCSPTGRARSACSPTPTSPTHR